MERHFKQNHPKFNQDYPEGSVLRADFVKRKKRELCSQQNLFKKESMKVESMVKASYEISLLLAKKKKPFSDGQIVKEALSIFAEHCNDQNVKKHAENISLSRPTVTRRMEEMSNDISSQIQDMVAKCKYFSLALDETCDLTSMSQLSIFVRCIDGDFNIFQDLLEICQLETTSKGEDIFLKIKECVERKNLEWKKLNSVCTDGAPAMMGKNNGCVALLTKFLGRPLHTYHCIIHQESLSAKDMKFNEVIDPVVRCINFIRARALHRREFRVLFEEEVSEHGELHMYCAVRWLSKGEMLKHFWLLKDQVLLFLQEKEALPAETCLLENEMWLCDLAFVVDVTTYLNKLNLKLQGKDSTVMPACHLPCCQMLGYNRHSHLTSPRM